MSNGTFQQVILIGNACADPEVRFTPSGTAVCNITVATSKSWNNKQTGAKEEKTEFHRVKIWGKTAEITGEYVRKGQKLQIVGEIETSKWKDQSGQDRFTTEVVVKGFNGVMQMLGSAPASQGNQQRQASNSPRGVGNGQQSQQYQQQQQQAPQYNEPPMNFDEDIPLAPIGLQYPKLMTCI